MNLLDLNIHLPITDPTWIFFLVLCVILFAPLLLGRLKIPHIIGMILAGVVLGKYGFNILERDSSFELFGKVGLYYIMFLAGLEMDLEGFKRNRWKAILFGTFTTIIPFVTGLLVGSFWLGFGLVASMLLSCIFASHTLVSYPIVGRYGLNRHPIVSVSVGGTMIALSVSLLVLAGISGAHTNSGQGWLPWLFFIGKCTAFLVFVTLAFPYIARKFFRRYSDNVMQFIFVLALLFLCAALAELAGLEGIFGAFVAGLLLNRLIPHVSPLMNRIEFVGNALFIPYFLIGVGMIINVGALFNGGDTLKVVGIMVLVATLTKWIAALLTQKALRLPAVSRLLMFGLSNAHAAGALAMVMVGTKIEIAPGEYLMNEDMLNGVVLMILFSCIISSIATEHAARKMLLTDENDAQQSNEVHDEKILIALSNPQTVEQLVNIAIMMRNPKSHKELMGLSVGFDTTDNKQKLEQGRKNLELAAKVAASADVPMQLQNRLSTNIVSGILHTLNESEATELVLGLHHKQTVLDSFLGTFTQNILRGTILQLIIVKTIIPVNTIRRVIVAVPPKAEYEAGFGKWIDRVCRIGDQLGCRVHFWGNEHTVSSLKAYVYKNHKNTLSEFSNLDDWDDLLLLTGQVNYDHLFVIVSARKGSVSYQPSFEELPVQINKYFSNNSLMLIYPDQYGEPQELMTFSEPHRENEQLYQTLERWFYRWFKKGDNA